MIAQSEILKNYLQWRINKLQIAIDALAEIYPDFCRAIEEEIKTLKQEVDEIENHGR